MTVSEKHTMWGEAFGVLAWLWFFHRARHDLPVVLGWRHPWEHEGGHDHGHHADHSMAQGWDKFSSKAMPPKDSDEDEEEEEEEEHDDDEDEE